MQGDKILIQPEHKKAGDVIYPLIKSEVKDDLYVITVGGESGSGKSEVATVLANKFKDDGVKFLILQQDDYFIYPPKTNHEIRKKDIGKIGPGEVRLNLLEEHIKSLKEKHPISKPTMNFDLDKATIQELSLDDIKILIIEGTYTTLLKGVNKKIFIAKSYLDTKKFREKRKRDTKDAHFLEEVVKIEHTIIKEHEKLADIVLDREYNIKFVK